ncbi:MAG TPA: adenosine kinase [Bacteroidales bacterium]|nr:adenosine kinase [Bacteroidales bacterium]
MKKVLGIGNALVDIIYFLENDLLLEAFSLPKGSMQLVDAETARQVEQSTGSLSKFMASGGSAANTIHGLAKLGVNTAFVGTVGDDTFGRFFESDMTGCKIAPLLSKGTLETGRAISLVSPGGERTFATYLGAAIELSAESLTDELFEHYDHLHLEGYLVPNQIMTEKAMKLAVSQNRTISLDLASYNVVEANLDFLKRIISAYKPVVFANEEEAYAFTGQKNPNRALSYIADLTSTAIVKTGAKGSHVFHNGKKYKVAAIPSNCIDTTGAGDLYAAGYIYGFINNLTPEHSGRIGSLLAGKVIEEAGAKICKESWEYIEKTMAGF